MSRYGFLTSPLWMAGIAIALLTVIAFVNLGLWQLRRLDERQAINVAIAARSNAEPVLLGTALATYGTDPESLVYTKVKVVGEYQPSDEVMVIGTTLNGRSGHDVLTPLSTDGASVAVNRGWVPIDTEGPPAVGADPPIGRVELVGVLLESQKQGSIGTPGPDGTYRQVGRIDLDTLSGQWGSDLLPLYLLLDQQAPAGGELPLPRAAPEPSEGSHLSYAVQWFIFALIALVGFPLLALQNARRPVQT